MGVINVSPESFFKGSVYSNEHEITEAAQKMTVEGADFLDIGAMSTAPYLDTRISEEEETRRLVGAIRLIRKWSPLPISVDTFRYAPACAAVEAGAVILNDVMGLISHPLIHQLTPQLQGLILMAHPSLKQNTALASPVRNTKSILRQSLQQAVRAGFDKKKIVIDPGIGFFRKTKMDWWKWDIDILKQLSSFRTLDVPVLVGLSRKSFIGKLLEEKPAADRLPGSLAATVAAVMNGASLLRTHDVTATKDAVRMAEIFRQDD
jgi:dihydropteroate synthase